MTRFALLVVAGVLALVSCASSPKQSAHAAHLDVGVIRAAAPGRLPVDGSPKVAGVSLPRGHREGGDGNPALLWVTDDVLPQAHQLVATLAAAFPRTGLWPVVLDDSQPGQTQDSWAGRQLDVVHQTEPATVDLDAIGRQDWKDVSPDPLLSPYDKSFPGLAPELTGSPLQGAFVDVLTGQAGRVGLIPVRRPADVPYAIGWEGATNYFDAGVVTAFLRSEEDRWGAVVVELGLDHLELALRRPPGTLEEARAVAGEQLGFCPDQITQGDFDTLAAYAASLVGRTEISCWWD